MRVVSLFSGVGGLDLGLERAGLDVVAQCEIDGYRRSILERHWPEVPRFEDVRDFCANVGTDDESAGPGGRIAAGNGRSGESEGVTGRLEPQLRADVLCGGFPCQDLSVAGRRRGLNGSRSGLFFAFARIAAELRPRWVLVENVPGLLSSAEGRDFAVVLSTLVDIGYGVAWRVLDARFFGVPQRRRRVFVVGHLGNNPQPALQALGQGGAGDPPTRGCTWQRAAERSRRGSVLARCLTANERWDLDTETFVVDGDRAEPFLAGTLQAHHKGYRNDADSAASNQFVVSALDRRQGGADDNDAQARHLVAFNATQDPITSSISPSLGGARSAMAVAENQRGEILETDYAHQLSSAGGKPGQGYSAVRENSGVRRLTPVECERLMSWPDGWTEPGPDTRRYAACGDGVVSNVAEWIGRGLVGLTDHST